MRVSTFRIFYLFLSIFLATCTTREAIHSDNSSLVLKPKGQLELRINVQTRNWSVNTQYFYDSLRKEEGIMLYNEPTNALQEYAMDGRLRKEWKFPLEGPDTPGKIEGFWRKSYDSLYVLNSQRAVLFRLGADGTIRQMYYLSDAQNSPKVTVHYRSTDGVQMYASGEWLLIPTLPAVDYFRQPSQYLAGDLGVVLDLSSGKIRHTLPFPSAALFKGKNYTAATLNGYVVANPRSDTFTLSFGADHAVYEYTLDTPTPRVQEVRSNVFREEDFREVQYREWLNDSWMEFASYLSGSYYERLIFDAYRGLYYRLVKHALPYEASEMRKQPRLLPKYSMVITDSKWNILGELQLPDGLGLGIILPTKDGLLIQSPHSELEESIRFEKFTVHFP